MKTAMVSHVDESRHTMFRQATDTVKGLLEEMIEVVQTQMHDKTRDILDSVTRDYTTVLVGAGINNPADQGSSEEPEHMADVKAALLSADALFALAGVSDDGSPGRMEDSAQARLSNDVDEVGRPHDHDDRRFEYNEPSNSQGCDETASPSRDQLRSPNRKSHQAHGEAGSQSKTPEPSSHNEFPSVEALTRKIKREPVD